MRLYKSLVYLIVAGVLTACGGGSDSSSKSPASSLAPSSASTVLSSSVGESSSTPQSSSLPDVSSVPSQVSSSAASAVSSVLPVERTKAHALWSFDAKAKVRSTAVINGDLVIFGSEKGRLYALNRHDGSERWAIDTGGVISSTLVIAEGRVIFLNGSGKIMAVDAESGTESWSIATGKEHFRDWGQHLASALVVGERVYIGSSNGKIYGLLPTTGEQVWSIDLGSPIHTTPFVVGGILYVSSDRAVHAVDIATQQQLWSKTFTMPTSPAVANGVLVVGSRQAYIYGLDSATGDERWKLYNDTHWVTGGPVIHEGKVYIGGSDDKRYHSLELATGTVNWRVGMGANVFSTPAIVEDISYVSSGEVYFDRPQTGLVRAIDNKGAISWTFTGKPHFSSPVVADEVIFIGSDDGFFYALPAN